MKISRIIDGIKDRQPTQLVIASVDPGKKNLGFRVERRYLDPTDPERCIDVETLVWARYSTKYDPSGKDEIIHIYNDILLHFDKALRDIDHIDIVLVEHQLTLAKREIIQIQQHITTYFMLTYRSAIIVDLDSHLKGRQLGYKPPEDLKKWSIRIGKSILEGRENDVGAQGIFQTYKSKHDDLTDTLLQIEAWCRYAKLGADWSF